MQSSGESGLFIAIINNITIVPEAPPTDQDSIVLGPGHTHNRDTVPALESSLSPNQSQGKGRKGRVTMAGPFRVGLPSPVHVVLQRR